MLIENLIKDLKEFRQMNPKMEVLVRDIEGVYRDNIRMAISKASLSSSETLLITSWNIFRKDI